MCPLHHFAPVAHCPLCSHFAGGFVGGFFGLPYRLNEGLKRINSQQGIILANPGKEEEEENRLIGKEIRATYKVLSNENLNVDNARQVWRQLPEPVRSRLIGSGYEATGYFAGSMAGGRLLLLAMGFLGGRLTTMHPRLRPLMAGRAPAHIAAAMVLALLSMQATCANLIARQRQIFQEYPGSEDALKDTLDKINKD